MRKFNFKRYINKKEWVVSQTIKVSKYLTIVKVSANHRTFYTKGKDSHGKIYLNVPDCIGFYDEESHTIKVHKKVNMNVRLSRCF